MNTTTQCLTALGLVVTLGFAAAPGAFAKAHDQKTQSEANMTSPGQNVGKETVGPAQNLGANIRSENAPDKAIRDTSPGNSGSAGRTSSQK